MKMLKSLVFAAIALSASAFANAQVYGGIGAGQSNVAFAGGYSQNDPSIAESTSSGNVGFKAFVGYDITANWAVEATYAKLGNATYSYASTAVNGSAEARLASTSIALKGTLPISQEWAVFAKWGVTSNQADIYSNSDNATVNANMGLPATFSYNTRSNVTGLGAEYALTKASKLRLEVEDLGTFGGDNLTLGKTTLVSVNWTSKF
jgi:OOP family OmpA-OmpF porin